MAAGWAVAAAGEIDRPATVLAAARDRQRDLLRDARWRRQAERAPEGVAIIIARAMGNRFPVLIEAAEGLDSREVLDRIRAMVPNK